ncbi:MurR/RpiR family transcriptional regulator [Thalassobacillus pellis]|uniref:MurR/RpiR family transcriptional regulator n=1 Tax=Thalassobacillus pellis TaxID=748008 RepID=UPI00196080F5|nr:MurR/RpiR family transcriptional regulator [Thalassobacillus pellis]MBM7553455.1 DNA-binding MurR/RpiR family transcriptional regulator [Thalassobacillus pellis]
MSNIYQHIAEVMNTMSKSQVKVARYILENPNTVSFLTVGKLAKVTEVSEATVVRFANFLGFSGYSELQQSIQESVQQQLSTTERLKMSQEVYNEREKGVREVFYDDIDNIKATMEEIDQEKFQEAVNHLVSANNIYIIANRSAKSLGVFLHYYLDMMLDNVELLHSTENGAERLHQLDQNDVVFGISFARYTNSTVEMFAYAKEKKAKTIALTDNLLSPLFPQADISLLAKSRMPTVIDSFAAPLSVLNALITAVSKERQECFHERLDALEDIWSKFDVFYNK